MNTDSRLIVTAPRGQNVILAIIFVVVVIVILIIVILRLRRNFVTTTTTTGSGSTDCVNDVDCNGTQVCSPSRGVCVDCLSEENCPINAPVCDQSNNKCVGCLDDDTCPSNKPNCDPITKQCVQCTEDPDCGGATPKCSPVTRVCVGCLSPADCPPGLPICDPGGGTCVECLSNSQCTSPAVCNNGRCCNTAAPTITSLGADITGPNTPHFSGTYTAGQPSSSTAVFQVLDADGNLLLETPGTAANGNISIYQPQINVTPRFYSSYTHQVRVRISQPCGATAFSAPVAVTMPFVQGATIPVIHSVGGNTGGFTVVVSDPNLAQGLCVLFSPSVYVIPEAQGPNLNLNFAARQDQTACAPAGANQAFSGNWPFPVSPGQKFWIRITGQSGYENVTPSFPVLFTVPTP